METVVKSIQEAKSFLVCTHYLPDGDGLGSQMAFHFAMQALGRTSYVVNGSPTPEKFRIADPQNEIQIYSPSMVLPKVDLIVVMDTSDYAMLGPLEAPLRALGSRILFVDHHVADIEHQRDHLIDETFGSTGELVYKLLRALQAPIDVASANAIYAAIITDTNHFRFRRTTPSSHRVAAELLDIGVQPERVYQSIYAHDSFAKVRLLGHVLKDIANSHDGRLAWITIPAVLRKQYGATVEDTESFVNQLTLMENVDIGIVFREEDDGRIKVSVRGNGDVPVYAIAKHFGGGGHRHAAGVRLPGPLEEVQKQILKMAGEVVAGRII